VQLNGNETDLPQLSDALDDEDWGSKCIKDRVCNGNEEDYQNYYGSPAF
jgi:hypothetical protein